MCFRPSLYILLLTLFSVSPVQGNTPFQFSDVSPRIIGGTNVVSETAYPWMVSLQGITQRSPTELSSHFCGGALIGKDWVLTAAHCLVDESFTSFRMYIGATNSKTGQNSELRYAEWFAIHPDYSADSFSNDIALIKLSTESNQKTIPLIDLASSRDLSQNELLKVIGWGLTINRDFSSASDVLQEVDVSFQSDQVCENTYTDGGINGYWDLAICAGELSGGKDACQGDSGGPLMVKADGEWALAGVVSWGSECGFAGSFGVYTEAAHYQKWIDDRRRGVSVVGLNKIGFLGINKKQAESYQLHNYTNEDQLIVSKAIGFNNHFEIDPNNWAIENTIPAMSSCDFTINALGNFVGEQNAQLEIVLEDNSFDAVKFSLNSKVLNSIDASALDTDWIFYSGTGENTEHGIPWANASETGRLNGNTLASGAIGHDERSVLISYVSGSGSEEAHYLKFDARVSSFATASSLDRLLVFSNDEFKNTVALSFAGNENNWDSYSFALNDNINKLNFIYTKNDKDEGGEDKAYLDNFRVCSDPMVESTCSAFGFNNNEDLGVQDDLQIGATASDVCTDLSYTDSDINHLTRIESDRRYFIEDNETLAIIKRRGSSGAFHYQWSVLLFALCLIRLRRKRV